MDQFRRGELVFDVIDAGAEDGPAVVCEGRPMALISTIREMAIRTSPDL
ncbi:hypothetical protein [Mycobacterium paraseoulense]|nr:hypothetical protein [Mycobacterium paraseoulense]MCV7397971.1 hypothetical protein [Mycobacterium paraseoulense]